MNDDEAIKAIMLYYESAALLHRLANAAEKAGKAGNIAAVHRILYIGKLAQRRCERRRQAAWRTV